MKDASRAHLAIRPAARSDWAAILELAERLPAFGPTTRTASEITTRERRALAEALEYRSPDSALFVAEAYGHQVAGVVLLETRRDYFTDLPHGHVSILAVAAAAEGQGVGRSLLAAGEDWARARGSSRLTLTVFVDNTRAKGVYARQGWQPELEIYFKRLDSSRGGE